MTSLYTDSEKYSRGHNSATAEAMNAAVREIVRSAYAASGKSWEDFVFSGSSDAIGTAELKAAEDMMVEAGHRFTWSASISAEERPDIYTEAEGLGNDLSGFSFENEDAPVGAPEEDGFEQRGCGDNVARFARPVTGTARYVRSPSKVLQYMSEGVPENTIAIIDDSGGTLTAPILEKFVGVICAGGSTRSHLGILTREYGVPCLMNAKISGIFDGDTVRIEASADPKTAADYQKSISRTAKIWRLTDSK